MKTKTSTARTRGSNKGLSLSRDQFGSLLKEHREQKGYTLQQLGDASRLSFQYVWKFESGWRGCGPDAATRLADSLELNGDSRRQFLAAAARTMVRPAVNMESVTIMDVMMTAFMNCLSRHGYSDCVIQDVRSSKTKVLSAHDIELVLTDGRIIPVEFKAQGYMSGSKSAPLDDE